MLTFILKSRYVGNHKRFESALIKLYIFCQVYGKYHTPKMKLDIFCFVYGQYPPTFKKKLNPSPEYKWIAKIKIYQFRTTHT